MPLQETSGTASYDAFGGGAAAVPVYIEDVFSTYLYTGNGATQTITNGIDLSGKGGLVWIKDRTNAYNHNLFDTARGTTKLLHSNTTDATVTDANSLTAFGTTGFTLGSGNTSGNQVNTSTDNFASWTFRKQPKFFDIVTYTGNGVAGRQIAHSLGSTPGFLVIKRTDAPSNTGWIAWQRAAAPSNPGYHAYLNTTADFFTAPTDALNFTNPTSTVFTVGTNADSNFNGGTYVAYLFAHNAGGFGLTGTDNVISCGAATMPGAGGSVEVNLGYEPQWVLLKDANHSGQPWWIFDTMRGYAARTNNVNGAGGNANALFADTSGSENNYSSYGGLTSTGFVIPSNFNYADNNTNIIYIAIRRGPMRTPTTGTSVYQAQTYVGDEINNRAVQTGIVTDAAWSMNRDGSVSSAWFDRLRGSSLLLSASANAENTTSNFCSFATQSGVFYPAGTSVFTNSTYNYVLQTFRRAPGFFDVVCYTGTGANTTQTHNLGVVPELMIVKQRSAANAWQVYSSALANTEYLVLNTTAAKATGTTRWNSTTPTASVFSIGTAAEVNTNAATYVAYLFATVAGVSKVGTYTGTGALQTVNCGFTSGARLVVIKRTDSTGDWYVYDSARGITSGSDPYLLLNTTNSEFTGTNYVDTDTTGFKVTAAAPAGLNANGGTYIFLAIA